MASFPESDSVLFTTTFNAETDPTEEQYNSFFDALVDGPKELVSAFFDGITDLLGGAEDITTFEEFDSRLHGYFHALSAALIRTATPGELECTVATALSAQIALMRIHNTLGEEIGKATGDREELLAKLKEKIAKRTENFKVSFDA